MTFDRRLPYITDPVLVFRGLYCPPLNIWWKRPCITANSQG